MIRQTIALSIALALVVPAAAGDRDIFNSDYLDLHKNYIEVLTKMAPANRKGAAAGAGYYLCNTAAAELMPGTPAEVADQCKAEEAALSALVQPDQFQALKAIMLEINAETVERVWRDPDRAIECAQAEWSGCAMKPIPQWKGVTP